MAVTLNAPVINAASNAQGLAALNQDLALGCSNTALGIAKAGILKRKLLGARPCTGFSSRHLSPARLPVKCGSSFYSDGNLAEDSIQDDENYINSTVLEAVEVKSGADGFMITMRDGRHIKCEHNNADGGHLPDYAPQPAIVLKMDDDSNLLLPIIVLELPCAMLMEAVRNIQVARPTVYNVMKDMIELMGYQPKLVRITKRVHEAYFARLYLAKDENGTQKICSLDVRPSDAINLAVRCQVPIQVNKQLAYCDGVRIVKEAMRLPLKGFKGLSLDRPESGTCTEAEEFVLVRSMMVAAVEERYNDAARLRDQLSKFRSSKKRQQEA
ncbi:bifunctional nuclease 1 [Selaginella moellendorffii]|uniref:bifunctional nuclease 1 n=1 Tax=Selaginella moellendorffii TaxID=88036 RepID=UPI000D1CE4FD|nr:bifunctional nuclease 1 [Selaginella moellendorffii]|eukprot:XP_024521949.1 bifunctional nuclease 1 [Selaginella moellendorffii]